MTQDAYRLQRSFEGLNPTEDNPATGYLGTVLNGAYVIVNLRYPNLYYVRFPDHRFISALHKGQVRPLGTFAQSVEVEIFVNERNEWEIKGIAAQTGDATEQVYGTEVYVPEHEHPATDITYTPSDSTLWDDPDPATVQEALDRLPEVIEAVAVQLVPLTFDGEIVIFDGQVVMVDGSI